MDGGLVGCTALVTGVSRRAGIGHAITQRLREAGANVFTQRRRALAHRPGARLRGRLPVLDRLVPMIETPESWISD